MYWQLVLTQCILLSDHYHQINKHNSWKEMETFSNEEKVQHGDIQIGVRK